MKILFAILFIAASTLATGAIAQNDAKQSLPASCPLAAEVSPVNLYGLWHAEFEGVAQGATLRLEKHPELTGSFTGGIKRDSGTALIAGDVDEGEFTLEESIDGRRITATWQGTVVENSCGKEIRGIWNNTSSNTSGKATSTPFDLRKLPGWP